MTMSKEDSLRRTVKSLQELSLDTDLIVTSIEMEIKAIEYPIIPIETELKPIEGTIVPIETEFREIPFDSREITTELKPIYGE